MATKRKTSNSKSRTNSRKKANTSKKATEFKDPFFKDSTKEIILWGSLAVCIMLLISNFGLGGVIGNAIADFFFGLFGMIQFIMPFVIVFSVFFIISNLGNKIAITKVVFGYIFLLFLGVFIELLMHGQNILGPVDVFNESKETHLGGGFFSGALAYLFVNNFDLWLAYIFSIIGIVVSIIIIVERFTYDTVRRSSKEHADRAALRRRERRERQLLEREANQMRFNSDRRDIQQKIEDDRNLQMQQMQEKDGMRYTRKRSGVSDNTDLNNFADNTNSFDKVSELKITGAKNSNDIEVVDSKRHKLKSTTKSRSTLSFEDEITTTPTIDNPSMQAKETEITINPVINTMQDTITDNQNSTTVTSTQSTSQATNVQADTETNQPEAATRHAKPSASSEKEIEQSSESVSKSIETEKKKPKKPYKFPPISLLNEPKKGTGDSKQYLNDMAMKLQRTLRNFGVEAEVKEVTLGPSVTQYKIAIDEGTKVSKVLNLSDDIKLNMAVTDVRIEAPIPGEPYIGIEVPNKEKTMVGFRELVNSQTFKSSKSKISFCVGKDITGNVIVGNIEKMPHLLIAGATGSGKSVCINTIIMSILYHATPEEVKMIMVDPKMVELSCYNGIPHLLIPVVTDPKKAAGALHWAVKEMTDRYELLAMAGVRNIENFNEKVAQNALPENIPENRRERMSQIVIILDELADLMMVAAADVEDSIVRLAQLARAAGIHLIIATQRPTANVITGLIKANVPSRIAFSVSNGVDSRVILDMNGAEDLLGNGDMLYAPQNLSKPIRVQGAFVSDDEVANVVDFLKDNNDTDNFNSEIEEQIQNVASSSDSVTITAEIDNSRDALFYEAGKLVIENQKGSIGYLQRNFRIGFNRAARIMDQLAEAGVVGPEMGTKPREIKMSISQFEEYINQENK